jgi:hypothetical protein
MTEATLLAQIIVIIIVVVVFYVVVISVNNLEFYSTETSSQSGKKSYLPCLLFIITLKPFRNRFTQSGYTLDVSVIS